MRVGKLTIAYGYFKTRTREKLEPKPRKTPRRRQLYPLQPCQANAEGQPLPSSAEPLLYDNTNTRRARTMDKHTSKKHYDECSHYSPSPPYLWRSTGPVSGARGAVSRWLSPRTACGRPVEGDGRARTRLSPWAREGPGRSEVGTL